jgi:serine/threonine-protein kinase
MQPIAEPANEEFGPYVVHERLGLGGMATVYRAKKRGIEGYERNVALKRMLSHLAEDSQFVESFIREAKVASLLVHPNIAQVYDFGRINGIYYIAMELVQGFDLRKMLREANRSGDPIPLPVILSVLAEMCDALDYAHTFVDEHGQALGIVHRDVSPSNLIVAQSGHVKMIDFGIAKAQSAHLKTESGQVKGKLGYMSPDAAMGLPVDASADVFSAGVVAWELITASPLFSAKSDFETMRRIREMEVVPPSRHNPQCPRELDELVLSAIARDERYRLHSAGVFRQKLDKIAHRAGIQINARAVAEWTARFTPTTSNPSAPVYKMPLAAPEGGLTQNIRPASGSRPAIKPPTTGSLIRSREDAEHASEIWGEDAPMTNASPGPDYSAMEPTPMAAVKAAPVPAFEPPQQMRPTVPQRAVAPPLPPPPRRSVAIFLVIAIVAVSCAITIVVWPKGSAKPADVAPRASLKLEIDPPDAIVEIGGKEITHASPFEAPLEPGVYTVNIHREGYKPWSSAITLKDDEHQPVHIALEHAMSHLVVDSNPRGLPIEIDGKMVPNKTMANLDVTAGDHHISVMSSTGERWQNDFSAVADGSLTLNATFSTSVAASRTVAPATLSKKGHHHETHEPEPTPEPAPEPKQPDSVVAKPPDPVVVKPPDPVVVKPPDPVAKPTRVPIVPINSVTKLSGELPALKVKGDDGNSDISAKLCIDETGRMTSVKILSAPAETMQALQSSLMSWRYQARATPACFLLSVRVVVKHSD